MRRSVCLTTVLLYANAGHAADVDAIIDQAMRPLADSVWDFIFFTVPIFGADLPLIVLWLIGGGVFFTVYLGFINIRGFKHAIDIVRGKYKNPDDPGEISQFQALTTAVSGTVGIGNIAGVAVAISVGGPGATLWLIIAGLLGMSTKFAECTLGVLFRKTNDDGSVSGGPMYYLEHGLAAMEWPRLGKALGMFYAASMVVGCLGIGNMFQSNQAAVIFISVTGGADSYFADKAWLVGLGLAIAVAMVIIGGIRTIATTTAKLVPGMALLYVVTALFIIALNYANLPSALAAIWHGAFSPDGVAGGVLGGMIIGFRRAVFSNEAGLGSAAIAHS
ncbi:MAG: alanine:cation symporter family protein, partial [Pseudomonadales bacterium]